MIASANPRRNRALFRNFLRREVRTRYLGSSTGLAWALLHPLALLGVYHFVFTLVFRAGGYQGKSFLLFVAIALWPWLAAQEGLQRAAVSLAGYAGLIRKVAFPHELVVYASVAATLLLQFVGYLAVLVVLALFGEPMRFEGLLLAIPLWIVMAVARQRARALVLRRSGVHPRRRARADAGADDAHVPDADPLSAGGGARVAAALGRGQSVQLAGRASARLPARRSAGGAVGRRRRTRRGAAALCWRPRGVLPAVAVLRGLRVSATGCPEREHRSAQRDGTPVTPNGRPEGDSVARTARPTGAGDGASPQRAGVATSTLLRLSGVGKDYAKVEHRRLAAAARLGSLARARCGQVFRALDGVDFEMDAVRRSASSARTAPASRHCSRSSPA